MDELICNLWLPFQLFWCLHIIIKFLVNFIENRLRNIFFKVDYSKPKFPSFDTVHWFLLILRVELLSQLVDSSGSDSGEDTRLVTTSSAIPRKSWNKWQWFSKQPLFIVFFFFKTFTFSTTTFTLTFTSHLQIVALLNVIFLQGGSRQHWDWCVEYWVGLRGEYFRSITADTRKDLQAAVYFCLYSIIVGNNQTASRWHWESHLLHFSRTDH